MSLCCRWCVSFGLGLVFRLAALLASPRRPTFAFLLCATGERKRVGGDILRDHASGADIGTVADLYRGDERGVRADKGPCPDLGPVLGEPIIVAGDGAGANVGARAHAGIADIGEMVDLGAFADLGLLDLHEIADMGIVGNRSAGPEPRKRPDDGARTDARTLD